MQLEGSKSRIIRVRIPNSICLSLISAVVRLGRLLGKIWGIVEILLHPPVVERHAPRLPPGDDFVARLAPGQVLGPLFLAEEGPHGACPDPPHSWLW